MRILIVGPSIERSKGGMATVISDQLTNATINQQNKLTYLISHVEGNLFEKFLYSAKSFFYILLKHKQYDIAHFHTAADASFFRKSVLLRLSKTLSLKTIMHIHGSDFDSFYLNRNRLLKTYIKCTLNKSNKVLVLSEFWKRFFMKEFPAANVEILLNGIDVNSFKSCINTSSEIQNYLFLGRLGERKGVYDLLSAINTLIHINDRKEFLFYLAGDGEIEKVKSIILKDNLSNNVQLLGWLNNEEKREILKDIQVVVLPSYDEGLPMALIEAMACGKVIISTYAGGIPDLVKQDINGYLFNAGDINSLVDNILFVANNPAAMKLISQNNIKTIADNFNLDTIAIKLNATYASL